MILTFRHRDSRSNQRYDGTVNIARASGYPSSVLNAGGPAAKGNITNNLQFLQLPINCVLAGDPGPEQKDTPRYITDLNGILRKIIYGE